MKLSFISFKKAVSWCKVATLFDVATLPAVFSWLTWPINGGRAGVVVLWLIILLAKCWRLNRAWFLRFHGGTLQLYFHVKVQIGSCVVILILEWVIYIGSCCGRWWPWCVPGVPGFSIARFSGLPGFLIAIFLIASDLMLLRLARTCLDFVVKWGQRKLTYMLCTFKVVEGVEFVNWKVRRRVLHIQISLYVPNFMFWWKKLLIPQN